MGYLTKVMEFHTSIWLLLIQRQVMHWKTKGLLLQLVNTQLELVAKQTLRTPPVQKLPSRERCVAWSSVTYVWHSICASWQLLKYIFCCWAKKKKSIHLIVILSELFGILWLFHSRIYMGCFRIHVLLTKWTPPDNFTSATRHHTKEAYFLLCVCVWGCP